MASGIHTIANPSQGIRIRLGIEFSGKPWRAWIFENNKFVESLSSQSLLYLILHRCRSKTSSLSLSMHKIEHKASLSAIIEGELMLLNM